MTWLALWPVERVSSWSSELELESGRLDGRVERVDRVEILCKILDLIHQPCTVDFIPKNLTLSPNAST